MNVNVFRVVPMSLVAVGSVVRYRQNRRQKFLQEWQEIFSFPLQDRPLTKREGLRVDQVVQGLEARYKRRRRLAIAIDRSRPGAAQQYVDDAYIALREYNRAVSLRKRIRR